MIKGDHGLSINSDQALIKVITIANTGVLHEGVNPPPLAMWYYHSCQRGRAPAMGVGGATLMGPRAHGAPPSFPFFSFSVSLLFSPNGPFSPLRPIAYIN